MTGITRLYAWLNKWADRVIDPEGETYQDWVDKQW